MDRNSKFARGTPNAKYIKQGRIRGGLRRKVMVGVLYTIYGLVHGVSVVVESRQGLMSVPPPRDFIDGEDVVGRRRREVVGACCCCF